MFVFASTDRGVSCSCLPPQTEVFHVRVCLHRQRCFMFVFASTDRGVSCSCLPPLTEVFHVRVCLHRQRCFMFVFASTDRGVSCSCLPPQTEVFHVRVCLHRQRCWVQTVVWSTLPCLSRLAMSPREWTCCGRCMTTSSPAPTASPPTVGRN